jgi:thiamine kinase-like enzyme
LGRRVSGEDGAAASAAEVAAPHKSGPLAELVARVPEWQDAELESRVLTGGLANANFVVVADGQASVVKLLTQSMDDFGLMIPMGHLLANTAAAGEAGVGARVLHSFGDVPAMVLEHIDGRTLCTGDLSAPELIPRIGAAIRRLHTNVPPFGNSIQIWDFLARYLEQVREYDLRVPNGLLDALPVIERIGTVLRATAMPAVASHNDLLPLNLMDDGEHVRLIDYDFSGASDPCFDLGDVAMEGNYTPDDIERLCESYAGERTPVLAARARLFGIAAQYTWSLLFVGMDALLPVKPDADFDYFQEASQRWDWARIRLQDADLDACIEGLAR